MKDFMKKAIICLLLVLSIALLCSCVDKSNKYGYSKYGNHSAAASNYYQSKKTDWEVYITYINGDGRYTDWNYHYYDCTRSEAERKAKDEIKYYDSHARNIDVIYVKEMH